MAQILCHSQFDSLRTLGDVDRSTHYATILRRLSHVRQIAQSGRAETRSPSATTTPTTPSPSTGHTVAEYKRQAFRVEKWLLSSVHFTLPALISQSPLITRPLYIPLLLEYVVRHEDVIRHSAIDSIAQGFVVASSSLLSCADHATSVLSSFFHTCVRLHILGPQTSCYSHTIAHGVALV
jgi:hypothetical protein